MSAADLQQKRILISAGPTWVPVDAVRHIGNFATGRLGVELAREARRRGADVTLLLGPTRLCLSDSERVALGVRDYTYFDELRALVRAEVASGRYHAFLHSAAVSDYAPVPEAGKIPSGRDELLLRLRPLPKIVDEVKTLDPRILLVKFKLEVGVSRGELLRIAQESRERSHADLVVANDRSGISEAAHAALIVGPEGVLAEAGTKEEIARVLLGIVAERLAAQEGGSR